MLENFCITHIMNFEDTNVDISMRTGGSDIERVW